MLNDETENMAMHVSYVDNEDKHDGSYMTNHALAAHVTAHARLRLYDEMSRVGENLLGHDIDSLWYAVPPGGYEIPEGVQLGEWEPEDIWTGRNRITGVQGTGPKSYTMRVEVVMNDAEVRKVSRETQQELRAKVESLCALVAPDTELSTRAFNAGLNTLSVTKDGITTQLTPTSRNRRAISAYLRKEPLELSYDTVRGAVEVVHSKGVTLNSQNAERIHYAGMKALIADRSSTITAVGTPMKRERIAGTDEMTIRTLRSEERQKIVRFTATKRDTP